MVFTEFAALVQSRWLLLRGGGDGAAGRASSTKADKKADKARKGRKTRGHSRSRRNGVENAHAVVAMEPQKLGAWVKGGAEDAALMRESLLASSPEEAGGAGLERFAESVGSTGGYSTLDEDDELQELLRRRSSLADDPVERACAEAAAAVGSSLHADARLTPGDAAGKTTVKTAAAKTLGSPDESVETEPEDEDEVLMLRDSARFSGYSTFDEEEEEEGTSRQATEFKPIELPQEEENAVKLVNALMLSEPEQLVLEAVDAPSMAVAAKRSLLELEPEEEEYEQLEADVACAQARDMFGQAATPTSASSFCATPSPVPAPYSPPYSPPYCMGDADEYACEMYANMRAREGRYRVESDLFAVQPSVRPKMRAVLVDWLVEVHQRFELEPQTLFLTVSYIDRYLASVPVRAQRLQLVGVAALLVASKFEEIYPCDMDDLLYICERSYSRDELIECERSLLNVFHFELAGPTVRSFLDYFVHALKLEASADDTLVAHLAGFLSESALVDFEFVTAHAPSEAAAASLLAACCFVENQPPSLVWSSRRQELTGYALEELLPSARALWQSVRGTLDAPDNELLAVSSKYAAEELSQVAQLPLDDLDRLLA